MYLPLANFNDQETILDKQLTCFDCQEPVPLQPVLFRKQSDLRFIIFDVRFYAICGGGIDVRWICNDCVEWPVDSVKIRLDANIDLIAHAMGDHVLIRGLCSFCRSFSRNNLGTAKVCGQCHRNRATAYTEFQNSKSASFVRETPLQFEFS